MNLLRGLRDIHGGIRVSLFSGPCVYKLLKKAVLLQRVSLLVTNLMDPLRGLRDIHEGIHASLLSDAMCIQIT